MAKYRRKPEIVEAFKWTGGPDQTEDPLWIIDALEKGKEAFIKNTARIVQINPEDPVCMEIVTFRGSELVIPGDYIIKDSNDNIYPIKPGTFEQTYELDITSSHRKLFNICKKIQSMRDAYNKNNEPFDSEELDRLLDEAIEKEEDSRKKNNDTAKVKEV